MSGFTKKAFLRSVVLVLVVATVLSTFVVSASALSYNGSASYRSSRFYTALSQVNLTGNQRTDIVNIAKSQIGYFEGNNSSQLAGNINGTADYTEYGRWYGMQDYWCAIFVSWCAMVAGVSTSVVPSHAYTPSGLGWFMNRGLAHSRASVAAGGYTPQPGDIIYFKSGRNQNITNHVGIVTGYSGGMIYTVEGNSSSAAYSTNGGAVVSKSYSIYNTYIVYICSPQYSGNAVAPTNQNAIDASFNASYYAAKNSDLQAAFGSNEDLLYAHFRDFGVKEGRRSSPIFSVSHYLNNNADLKAAFGNDYQKAYDHYLSNGYAEVRNTAPYVDLGADFYAKIECANSDLNVSIASATGEVITYRDTDSDAQWWHFIRQADGSYKIVNKKTGTCLDVSGSTYQPNAKVQLYADNGSNGQRWYIHKASSGRYVFRPKCSSMCVLDISGGSTAEGASLMTYLCQNTKNQQFTLEKYVEPPVISGVKVTDRDETGYTVTCTVTAEAGVDRVLFPTWTRKGAQDDIVWHKAKKSGNTYTFRVKTSAHNKELGDYFTHIYAYDKKGNVTVKELPAITLAKTEPPVISGVKVTDRDETGYTVTCTVTAEAGVDYVLFPTWTRKGAQDDIVWHKAKKSGNTYTFRVKTSAHNKEFGDYFTHIYAYDKKGNVTVKELPAITVIKVDPPVISGVKVTKKDETGYTITCTVTADAGVDYVLFPTWTRKGAQDDIVWHKAKKSGTDTYTFRVNVADHNQELGDYFTHIYAYDKNGKVTVKELPAITLTKPEPPVISDVTITDKDKTGYTITCTVTAEAGVDYVLFPTWSRKNAQDDIVWHKATKNGNTYSFRVNVADHNGEVGEYFTHIYAYDKQGNVTVKEPSVITVPKVDPPAISGVKITKKDATGYTVTCTVTAEAGVDYVLFPTWTRTGAQDDIVWHKAQKKSGTNTYTFRVNVADHNQELGDYFTHIYAYDKQGNITAKELPAITLNA